MLQRTIVSLLLVIGAICLGYGAMSYDPPEADGSSSWLVALIVGGILTPASILHLTGIAYSEIGFSLRNNWSGRLLGRLSRDEKNPDAELAHCALYASGLMAGVIGLVLLAAVTGGALGIHSIITGWNSASTQSTPVDWGVVGMTSGYVLLGLTGLAVAIVVLTHIAKSLSSYFDWKEEVTLTTIAALVVFAMLVLTLASTSKGSIGILGAMWTVIYLCAFGIGVGFLTFICVALISAPLWAHIAIKKFFPNLYVRICPTVRDTLRPKTEASTTP